MLSSILLALTISQNALDGNLRRGSATALDRGLQQGVSSNAAAASSDYRTRNLLVTGDVAGGRGFRGSVGYTAAEDFRGATAGDSTRAFRANSATTSADALANIAMNDRFSVATGIGATAYRRDFVGNNPTAIGSSNTAENSAVLAIAGRDRGLVQPTRTLENNGRVRLDLLTRQSATNTDFVTAYQPMPIGTMRTGDNRTSRLLATPFSGMSLAPSDDLIESLNHGIYSSALLRSDFRSGRASGEKILRSYLSPLSSGKRAAQRAAPTAPPSAAGGSAVVPERREVRAPYDRVFGSVAERYRTTQKAADAAAIEEAEALGTTSGVIGDLRARLQLGPTEPLDETDRLLGSRGAVADTAQLAAPPTANGAGGQGSAASKSSTQAAPGDPKVEESSKMLRKLTPDEAYLMLAHGEVLNQLDAGTREALDTILQTADRAMRDGRYISAEKVFTTAAQIAPAHPLPIAGLSNAQVAAGLQLSAATSLRRLFTEWPEMIDTRYGMEILGSQARVAEIGKKSLERGAGSKYASEYGLVAAYVGHQLNDRAMIESGLALMERDASDEVLTHALRVIWLEAPDAPSVVAPEVTPQIPQ
ncbi:MAG: hypothetical protein EXS17_03565 [Phycisphaerales bacterium]|nr:hypothetical protein [Phycisphaerales bacterium]